MPIIGIIAEYNPFHNGHIYQIQEIRRQYPDAHIVVVMSGAFTQRGLPAILDKWTRASIACMHGAELVAELPAVFALRSAQDFARGGIALLHRLGCVDCVAFGSESSLSILSSLTSALEDASTQKEIQRHIQAGDAYAVAVSKAVANRIPMGEDILRAPNNILAVEYLRSLHQLQSSMEPLALLRKSAAHNETNLQRDISSATSIRLACKASPPAWDTIQTTVPSETYHALQAASMEGYPSMDTLHRLLIQEILTQSDAELRKLAGISEGIEHRLRQAAKETNSCEELAAYVQNRRFPYSRVQRLLSYVLLRLTKDDVAEFDRVLPLYVRPLAFKKGTHLLTRIKAECRLPLISRVPTELTEKQLLETSQKNTLQKMLRYDVLANDLQALSRPAIGTLRQDYLRSPVCLP